MTTDENAVARGLQELDRAIQTISRGNAQLDPEGRCRLRYQRISVHVRAIPALDLVIFKSFINFVPHPNTGMVLPLYYHLLDQNDALETGEAYFALVPAEEAGTERDVISMEARRPLSDITLEGVRRCLASVALTSDAYIIKLRDEFQAPPVP